MAANAVCEASDRAIPVSDGTDAVQGASQPHPVVCMKRVLCRQGKVLFSQASVTMERC